MHSTMSSIALLASFLISSVLASPTGLETRTQNISTVAAANSNTSLGYPSPPEGPDELTINVRTIYTPLQPKDIFKTVITTLQDICQNDFDSRMPQANTNFRGDDNVAIRISSVDPAQPIFRRYIMWATAKLMLKMWRDIGYHACGIQISWQGIKVGDLFVVGSSSQQLVSGYTTISLDSATTNLTGTNTTTTMVGNEQLTWTYEPFGKMMTSTGIAMGTIEGTIQAAEFAAHNFDFYVGSFHPFKPFPTYSIDEWPSLFSKSVLIKTMAAAALWALNNAEYHNLRVNVLLNNRRIAHGGIFDLISPVLSNSNNSTAVSTS